MQEDQEVYKTQEGVQNGREGVGDGQEGDQVDTSDISEPATITRQIARAGYHTIGLGGMLVRGYIGPGGG